MMATEIGKGVVLGLWAISQLQRDPSRLGGGYNAETKGYTKDNIAALMGFAGVYTGQNLPDIWELFNATNGKKWMPTVTISLQGWNSMHMIDASKLTRVSTLSKKQLRPVPS